MVACLTLNVIGICSRYKQMINIDKQVSLCQEMLIIHGIMMLFYTRIHHELKIRIKRQGKNAWIHVEVLKCIDVRMLCS